MPTKKTAQKNSEKNLPDLPQKSIHKQELETKNSPHPKPFLEWKFQFNECTENYEFTTIELSDGSTLDQQSAEDAFKRATGSSDLLVGEKILRNIAFGMTADTSHVRLNEISSLLPALNPKNETEALLLVLRHN
ncbi:MAG: hypothetical protein KR126chlam3_01558 [Chlamydiae bacterium]|nr:hypothetical protein [Chlamydiota bacterium]